MVAAQDSVSKDKARHTPYTTDVCITLEDFTPIYTYKLMTHRYQGQIVCCYHCSAIRLFKCYISKTCKALWTAFAAALGQATLNASGQHSFPSRSHFHQTRSTAFSAFHLSPHHLYRYLALTSTPLLTQTGVPHPFSTGIQHCVLTRSHKLVCKATLRSFDFTSSFFRRVAFGRL